jgi:hypothetical protein
MTRNDLVREIRLWGGSEELRVVAEEGLVKYGATNGQRLHGKHGDPRVRSDGSLLRRIRTIHGKTAGWRFGGLRGFCGGGLAIMRRVPH